MSESIVSQSLFDSIRRFSEEGQEYWSARELMHLLGYTQWRRFEDSIQRAKIACHNSGQDPESHFAASGNLVKRAQGGGSIQSNYSLTRYAAYLIAMNGDPRKPEIAAAQTYFAIQTRRAETVIPAQTSRIQELELSLALEKERNLGKQLDNTLLQLHGKETVLTLRGHKDQVVKSEPIVVVEVVDQVTGTTERIIGAEELKRVVKRKTGQTIKTMKELTDRIRAAGRDDLLVPVKRQHTTEYLTPETVEEALGIVYGSQRQSLLGE